MTEPVLSCRDVACGYEREHPVLTGCSLDVGAGEVVTIVGTSGSGKTTLLMALSGLAPPFSGEVTMLGEPLYRLDAARQATLRRRTGMVFQHDALFGSLTLRENVALPVRELTDLPERLALELAQSKLDLVDIGELAHRTPAEVSGGQRKRAALARALVMDPAILFCDEPTAALDPVTAGYIDRTLLHLRDALGLALVAVTHDVESVRSIADRALVLGEGRVLAAGTSDALAASDVPLVRGFFHRVELRGEVAHG